MKVTWDMQEDADTNHGGYIMKQKVREPEGQAPPVIQRADKFDKTPESGWKNVLVKMGDNAKYTRPTLDTTSNLRANQWRQIQVATPGTTTRRGKWKANDGSQTVKQTGHHPPKTTNDGIQRYTKHKKQGTSGWHRTLPATLGDKLWKMNVRSQGTRDRTPCLALTTAFFSGCFFDKKNQTVNNSAPQGVFRLFKVFFPLLTSASHVAFCVFCLNCLLSFAVVLQCRCCLDRSCSCPVLKTTRMWTQPSNHCLIVWTCACSNKGLPSPDTVAWLCYLLIPCYCKVFVVVLLFFPSRTAKESAPES